MIRLNNGLVCDYCHQYGMWCFTLAAGWRQINTVKPDKISAVDVDGDSQEELVAGFTGYGLFYYEDPGVWTQINAVVPDAMVRHSHGLICNFSATYGLWFYNQARGWQQWNTVNPVQMVAVDIDKDGTDELVASFAGYGLFVHYENGSWSQLNTVVPENMIAIDFFP